MNGLQTKRKGAPRGVRLQVGQWLVDAPAAVEVVERRGLGYRSVTERTCDAKLAIGIPDYSPAGSVAGFYRNRRPRRLFG
jgi:hypothetical protein